MMEVVAAEEGGSVSWSLVAKVGLVVAAGKMRLYYGFPEDGCVLVDDDLIQVL